jgi:hypothetical protein
MCLLHSLVGSPRVIYLLLWVLCCVCVCLLFSFFFCVCVCHVCTCLFTGSLLVQQSEEYSRWAAEKGDQKKPTSPSGYASPGGSPPSSPSGGRHAALAGDRRVGASLVVFSHASMSSFGPPHHVCTIPTFFFFDVPSPGCVDHSRGFSKSSKTSVCCHSTE